MRYTKAVAEILCIALLSAIVGCTSVRPIDRRLLGAARFAGTDEVRQCLSEGANVNAREKIGRSPLPLEGGRTPVDWAAGRRILEMAELLLDRGARVNARDGWGLTALIYAAGTGNTELAVLLIARGAEVNAGPGFLARRHLAYEGPVFAQTTPLLAAVGGGHAEMVELLLAHGADANAKDPLERSAVH